MVSLDRGATNLVKTSWTTLLQDRLVLSVVQQEQNRRWLEDVAASLTSRLQRRPVASPRS